MTLSFVHLLVFLSLGILLIVLLTTKMRIHAFFALLLACFVVGLGSLLSFSEVISSASSGFGNIMKSLGIIIVLGTTLGLVLERTGATSVMANYILSKVTSKYSALAMAVTGWIVGLPIFCDSGYIVLSGLNRSLVRKTGKPTVVISVSLASGLYSVHCLIPPHPGATAAAGIMGVDYGRLIFFGIVVSIPAMLVGHLWAVFAGKRYTSKETEPGDELKPDPAEKPSVLRSFLPIITPIILIALKAFLLMGTSASSLTNWQKVMSAVGDPVTALMVGVVLSFTCKKTWSKQSVSLLLQDAVEKAGGILVIIGAGGAFGAVLQATKIAEQFQGSLPLAWLGILFPFLLTSLLKTALGSSTVSIITSASIILPLLTVLGLNSEVGRLLAVLAMGAGSMMISHANDAYFWVISRFSEIEMKTMLKVYSVATVVMGLTSFAVVYILRMVLM
ncbi:MAG: GntP family permease [Flavisolibacter sp.]